DWKANVRAIWAYHTYTRKWGDIGYNYLVDPNGVIYEGHLGGDDVIGTHAADANRGGMGVALLGTFSTSTPPEPMVNSLVELFAWKADQRSIDLFDASRLPLLDWGLLHLIGHRDVYGTTACPGGIAHSMIDDIRDRINVKLNYDSEYSYVDEGSAEVSFANANWHNAPYACGFNSHSQFTFSTDDPSESANWGEYRPQIPETGTYEVQVYVPRCNTGEPDTRKATYVINHLNGTDTVVVNQSANLGLWVSLGEYDLGQGNGGSIRLGDLVNGEHWRAIWYDTIRFTSREISSLTNATPQANSWQHDRSVTFTWDTAFKTNMSSLQLLVSTTSDFSNLIVEQSLSAAQTNYTHNFNADYAHLYWQLKAITSNSGVVYSAPSHFSLDATAPSANITSGEQIEWNYAVTWQGSDTLSGLSGYKLEYRETGASSWTLYKSYNASTNSATFVPPKIGISTTYQLRIRASDQAGNLQAGSANGDISTVNIPSWDFDHLYLSVIERP
ncbi:MAG: N-acetylmuramoyl-L-alanine amidase, partial [Methylococcales bacterium]|nr:N-acetylmuramoyl-L-alanine amidase [Methylococcales bacterium]